MEKYNKKNANNPLFIEKRKQVIDALMNSPRSNNLNSHPLKGKFKGYWSIDTGLNSNADRVIYYIDDETKSIFYMT